MVERGADEEREGHSINRIVVALDPSAHSRAALKAAAEIARRFDADLCGLFIEDINVRRLAELPFVQEVGLYTGTRRRVETRELTRQLRVQAGRMKREFRITTRHIESRCTFRETRGRVAREVVVAAAEADVVIIGKGAWSPIETGRLAPEVREVLTAAPASTLVLQARAKIETPVRVVYTGTRVAERALRIGIQLAEDGDLMVFVLADDSGEARRLQEKAREAVEGRTVELMFETLSEASVSRLTHLVAREERGTLVLPADGEALTDEALLEFLDDTRTPVLLVREASSG